MKLKWKLIVLTSALIALSIDGASGKNASPIPIPEMIPLAMDNVLHTIPLPAGPPAGPIASQPPPALPASVAPVAEPPAPIDAVAAAVELKHIIDWFGERYGSRRLRESSFNLDKRDPGFTDGQFDSEKPSPLIESESSARGIDAFFRPEVITVNLVETAQLQEFLNAYENMRTKLKKQGLQEDDSGNYHGLQNFGCTPSLLQNVRDMLNANHALKINQRAEIKRLYDTIGQLKSTLRKLELRMDSLVPLQQAELAQLENWASLSVLLIDDYYAKSYSVSYQGDSHDHFSLKTTIFRPYALIANEDCMVNIFKKIQPAETYGPIKMMP